MLVGAGCGNGSEAPDNKDVLAYVGLEVGKVFEYEVAVDAFVLQGRVTVVKIDKEFIEGVDAYQVEIRQNQLLVATRWYQVGSDGLLLLGEQVQEGTGVVDRTYQIPILVIPYPLEDERGVPVQSWSTDSDLVEGGSERHRFDNAGKADLTVPAGTFSAFHLVHTRTDKDGGNHQLDEHFAPMEGFVQFEYPEDNIWTLLP
jgi:hypothetical protein